MPAPKFVASAASIHWKTPGYILDAVRHAIGGKIDLDPCAGAGTEVAIHNWTLPDHNGLVDDWAVFGRGTSVFVNHPFGTSYIKNGNCIGADEYKELVKRGDAHGWTRQTSADWSAKAALEAQKGCEVYWLAKYGPETKATQRLLRAGAAECVFDHRVNYVNAATGAVQKGANFASVLIYLGAKPQAFKAAFDPYGVVNRLGAW